MQGPKGRKQGQRPGLFRNQGRAGPFHRQKQRSARPLPDWPGLSLETYLEVPTYLRWGRPLTLEQHLRPKKRSPWCAL